MKKIIVYIVLILSGLVPSLESAAQVKPETQKEIREADASLFEDYIRGYYSQVFGVKLDTVFNTELFSTIEKWLGTPYRYAGKTLDGIDCSAFVNKIYEHVYCYLLEGNSSEMAQKVTRLPREKLKEGDLVFFRINRRNISHVGLYLGDDKFAHASRSSGVIISDLNQPYYRKYFVKGGRVNFPAN